MPTSSPDPSSFLDLAADLLDPPPTPPNALNPLLPLPTSDDPSHLSASSRLWHALPHQIPPPNPGLDWFLWLLMGGRGTGKTDACAAYITRHVMGPPCLPHLPGGHRVAIVGPTLGDTVEACVNGPSGLRAHDPRAILRSLPGGTYVRWPNHAEAKLFGAYTKEDIERLRAGGNRCVAWVEELAALRYLDDAWNHLVFGLRLGSHPHVVASTTPKNRKKLKELLLKPTTRTSHGTTDDNPHLAQHVRDALIDAYGGTRLGRQELYGELLEDVEGSLWTLEQLDQIRIPTKLLDPNDPGHLPMRRVVVAVDPSWGTRGDEVGIVVAGLGLDQRGYVIADYSGRMTPAEWGRKVEHAYRFHRADRILAEVNFQAEQVKLVMKTTNPTLTFKPITVSRGKQLRAEPVVALYEQGKISHADNLPGLEEQMTQWVPFESDFSPDRVDALVFALSELMLTRAGGPLQTSQRPVTQLPPRDFSLPNRRHRRISRNRHDSSR